MTKSPATEVKYSGTLKYALGTYEQSVKAKLEQFRQQELVKKIWQRDASVWTGKDEDKWLGWLDIVAQQQQHVEQFKALADEVRSAGYTQALLLGMGGSSLCVEVLRLTFGVAAGAPDMHVLDSTVPAQVLSTRKKLDLAKTVIIVASKSGGTTEPNVLLQYFYDETKKAVGDKVGEHFIAVTDPGSSMEARAKELNFKHVYYGVPDIGGRFSALSHFGMIPSAVMCYDVQAILDHAHSMVSLCGPTSKVAENPGVVLGTVMGVLALQGRDKVTIVTSPAIHSVGPWLEQLLAESTGKEGKGLVPIAGEELLAPDKYSKDRLFIHVRLSNNADKKQDDAIKALEKAGHPVVYIEMPDKIDVGAEFFLWEFATAVAGVVLDINAFDQPNVQESKDFTKKFLAEYESTGKLPEDILLHEEDGIKLYVDAANHEVLSNTANKTLDSYIAAHLAQVKLNDYFAINAYIDRTDRLERQLQGLRDQVLEHKRVATTIGFGPRFLHSTGQLHKGGPNTGVFVQVTSDDQEDVSIPGEKFTFGVLKNAQSAGDFLALSNRQRRLLRVHLPANVEEGLKRIEKAFLNALR